VGQIGREQGKNIRERGGSSKRHVLHGGACGILKPPEEQELRHQPPVVDM
jgi:hypothetical protein